ncbi:MAG: hypothetical protein AAGJ28_09325 [Pseudomonadota bacterium]
MRNFEARWDAGIQKFLDTHRNVHTRARDAQRRRAARNPDAAQRRGNMPGSAEDNMRALNMVILQRAFSTSTFIYGTTGPRPIQNGGKGSGLAVQVISIMNRRWEKLDDSEKLTDADIGEARKEKAVRLLQKVFRNIQRNNARTYDPGPRANEYIREGHQMMDMYFGQQGKPENVFWQFRNDVIAEFVHYVMDYHTTVGGRTGIQFDKNESGWRTFERHFNTNDKGWTGDRYGPGQSATKEISKIIRHGIKTFGGKLIFEGRDVYGHNVFAKDGWPRDTDVEARDLFQYYGPRAAAAVVPMGNGTLEFQWNGTPTVLTRAHFLSNWAYDPKLSTHTAANRKTGKRPFGWFSDFLRDAMKPRERNRFLPLWEKFDNYPPGATARNDTVGMMEAILSVS